MPKVPKSVSKYITQLFKIRNHRSRIVQGNLMESCTALQESSWKDLKKLIKLVEKS